MALFGDGAGNQATISKGLLPTGGGFRPLTIAAVGRLRATTTAAFIDVMNQTGPAYALIWHQGSGFQYEFRMTSTGTFRTVTHTVPVVGRVYTLVGVNRSNVQAHLYVNGNHGGVTATGTAGAAAPSWNEAQIGFYNDGAISDRLNGEIYLTATWKRALTQAEIRSFSANPYQMLRPKRKVRSWTSAGAGGVTNFVTASATLVLDAAQTLLVQKNTTARLVLDASRTLQIAKAVTARLNLVATKTFTLARSMTALLLLDATLVAQFVVVKSMTAILNLAATESDIITFQRSVSASMNLVATRQLQVARSLSAQLGLRATRTSLVSKTMTARLNLSASLVELATFLVSASATLLLAATLNAQRVYVRSLTATLNLAADVTALFIPFAPAVASTVIARLKGMIANIGSFMRR